MQQVKIRFPIIRFIGFINVGGGVCEEGPSRLIPVEGYFIGFVELLLCTWLLEVGEGVDLAAGGGTFAFGGEDGDRGVGAGR